MLLTNCSHLDEINTLKFFQVIYAKFQVIYLNQFDVERLRRNIQANYLNLNLLLDRYLNLVQDRHLTIL